MVMLPAVPKIVHNPGYKATFREYKEERLVELRNFTSNPGWSIIFYKYLQNFPFRELPPLYSRKSALFFRDCLLVSLLNLCVHLTIMTGRPRPSRTTPRSPTGVRTGRAVSASASSSLTTGPRRPSSSVTRSAATVGLCRCSLRQPLIKLKKYSLRCYSEINLLLNFKKNPYFHSNISIITCADCKVFFLIVYTFVLPFKIYAE